MTKKKYPISLKEVEAEYQELSARMNYGGSRYLPRIIKKALTLEQARITLEFYNSNEDIGKILGISADEVAKDPKKYQVEAICKKLKLDKKIVENHIQYMFEVGFIFPTRRGWRFARNMMQLKDSMTNPKFDEQLGDEFFDLWEAYQKIEAYPTWYLWNYAKSIEMGPMFRIIPARKAIEKSGIPYEDIIPEENLAEILKQYSLVAVEHCPCARLVRDRACGKPTEVCLIMDRVAEHNLRRDAARVVNLEEALAIHDMACDFGAAAVIQSNEKKPTALSMVCHCHWDCCDELAPAIMLNMPLKQLFAPSCYQTAVDPDKCIGCQTCLTRCQFGAIEMKQYPGGGRQEKLKAWVNPDMCVGCGLCVIKCPADARTMTMVRTGDSIPEKPTIAAYTAAPPLKEGKHMDTGSVMIRPMF